MDKLRPGDVSPTATSPDEYRAQHNVSPISPVAENERHAPGRGTSRRWRTFPTNYFDVSPESPPQHLGQIWSPAPDTRFSSIYSQDSSLVTRPDWSKDIGVARVPGLPLQDSAYAIPEEGERMSIDSLQDMALGDSEQKWASRALASATPTPIPTSSLGIHHSCWKPIWLCDWFLISFGIGCAILAIVLFALYLVSSNSLGLGSYGGPASLVYLWKYIPTTVLVSLLSLWNSVDFTARLLQPWDNLRNGPASAERSIFLDLITPFWPVALMTAVRSGSFVPLLTIAGVILLNIVVIFSTGLLQVETVEMVGDGAKYKEDRIQVRIGVVAPIITLLLVCLGLSITVLFRRSQDVVPRDPRNIGSLALLLQCNPELSYDFRSDFRHLRYHLQHERFLTLWPCKRDVGFALVREAMNPTFQPARGSVQNMKTPIWWQPVTLRAWCRVLEILLPLALIGALEGVQQTSDRSNGIAIAFSSGVAHYAITIIPAIAMWCISVLYTSINFDTVLLAPYYALSNGATYDRTLFSHGVGRSPLMQLLSSLRQGNLATVCTALAAIIGSWLIIIVSGLYSVTETKIVQNRAPKLALQVLLGVMTLCLVVSSLCMRTDGLLPHNPCSIAGAATLLAGGELWKARGEERRGPEVPQGAEWMSEKDLKRHNVWKDTVFGLGWWPDGRYGIDSGGRIDGG